MPPVQGADPFGLIGQVLDGQFRVDKFVGEGGFSIVYRGHHVGLEEPIAIKCLKLPPALGTALVDNFMRRFRDESRIHYRLSQGNLHICRSMASGTTMSPVTGAIVPYMVLEWLEGRSLAQDFEARRVAGLRGRPVQEVVKLLDAAVEAVAYAHAQGVVHRDLNTGNLFLSTTRDGVRVKVLDFGVAKIVSDGALDMGPRVATFGQIRIFAPAYGAPEQFDDRLGPVGPWTDVYALALVFIEALRDHTVMEGEHLGEYAMKAVDTTFRPTPRALGVAVGDELEATLAKALAVVARERPQDAGEFWGMLKNAVRRDQESGRPPRAGVEAPAPGRPSASGQIAALIPPGTSPVVEVTRPPGMMPQAGAAPAPNRLQTQTLRMDNAGLLAAAQAHMAPGAHAGAAAPVGPGTAGVPSSKAPLPAARPASAKVTVPRPATLMGTGPAPIPQVSPPRAAAAHGAPAAPWQPYQGGNAPAGPTAVGVAPPPVAPATPVPPTPTVVQPMQIPGQAPTQPWASPLTAAGPMSSPPTVPAPFTASAIYGQPPPFPPADGGVTQPYVAPPGGEGGVTQPYAPAMAAPQAPSPAGPPSGGWGPAGQGPSSRSSSSGITTVTAVPHLGVASSASMPTSPAFPQDAPTTPDVTATPPAPAEGSAGDLSGPATVADPAMQARAHGQDAAGAPAFPPMAGAPGPLPYAATMVAPGASPPWNGGAGAPPGSPEGGPVLQAAAYGPPPVGTGFDGTADGGGAPVPAAGEQPTPAGVGTKTLILVMAVAGLLFLVVGMVVAWRLRSSGDGSPEVTSSPSAVPTLSAPVATTTTAAPPEGATVASASPSPSASAPVEAPPAAPSATAPVATVALATPPPPATAVTPPVPAPAPTPVTPSPPAPTRVDPAPPSVAPTAKPSAASPPPAPAFPAAKAKAALDVVNGILASCRKPGGVTGKGVATVSFAPDGSVTSVLVDKAPFGGTPEAACIASRFRLAKMAAYEGPPGAVDYTFNVPTSK